MGARQLVHWAADRFRKDWERQPVEPSSPERNGYWEVKDREESCERVRRTRKKPEGETRYEAFSPSRV